LEGDIVIMDDVPSRKADGVQAAIEAAGATLRYLPRIPQTSIRSRPPHVRRCCANAPNAPNEHWAAASVNSFGDRSLKPALTSSRMLGMQYDRNPL